MKDPFPAPFHPPPLRTWSAALNYGRGAFLPRYRPSAQSFEESYERATYIYIYIVVYTVGADRKVTFGFIADMSGNQKYPFSTLNTSFNPLRSMLAFCRNIDVHYITKLNSNSSRYF